MTGRNALPNKLKNYFVENGPFGSDGQIQSSSSVGFIGVYLPSLAQVTFGYLVLS